MKAHRWTLRVAWVFCFIAFSQAIVTFTAEGSEFKYKTQFSYGVEVGAIATDSSHSQAAGDTYVVGYRLGAVKFNAKHGLEEVLQGTTLEIFGVTVDESSGNVYVSDFEGGVVDEFNAAGVLLSQCAIGNEPTAVAFDQHTSSVYVMLHNTRVVDRLDFASCKILNEIIGAPGKPFGSAMYGGLAVDQSTGDIYVGDSSNEVVDKFDSSGAFLLQLDGKATQKKSFLTAPAELDVAVSQSTGDVYVADINHHVVDQFSSTGQYIADLEGVEREPGRFTTFELPRAVAVDGATGDLYVGDSSQTGGEPEHEVVDIFEVINAQDVETGTAAHISPTMATFNGTINPLGVQPVSCGFEYGPEENHLGAEEQLSGFIPCTQSLAEIGSGETPVPVSAEVTGLTVGKTYLFRLMANGQRGTVKSFFTPVMPVVSSETVGDVSDTSATLSGLVNSGGGSTRYRFEYGRDAAYGSSSPIPDGEIEAGADNVPVTVHIQGLAADSVYHFRLVAENAGGIARGEDKIFHTQRLGGPFVLADGRIWELVSPANKNGALILTSGEGGGGGAALQASMDGSAISYSALGSLGEGQVGNAQISQLLSRRTSAGWFSENISPPNLLPKGATFVPPFIFFSFDLSSAVVRPLSETSLASGGTGHSLYIRDNISDTYKVLEQSIEGWYNEEVLHSFGMPKCDPSSAPSANGEVLGMSYNRCHVYFESSAVLAPGATAGAHNLYVTHEDGIEWATAFIAQLSEEDERDWAVGNEAQGTAARVSPNGRYVAFMSSKSLTGYENTDARSGIADEEVFLYDSATGRIVCVSCNPTGARPEGLFVVERGTGLTANPGPLVDHERAWEAHWLAGSLTPARNTRGFEDSKQAAIYYEPRNLSDEGRLFFDSPDTLVPQDTNGKEDVYEYEPEGVGSCNTSSVFYEQESEGCISLISSGLSTDESAFLDASDTGNDVFFLTQGRLTPQDYDTSRDVYDAHVCSNEAPCVETQSEPPPCDTSDSCKSPPAEQGPVSGTLPSMTFMGEGNVPTASGQSARHAPLTDAQKLARALKECKRRPRKMRRRCSVLARKKYIVRRTAGARK